MQVKDTGCLFCWNPGGVWESEPDPGPADRRHSLFEKTTYFCEQTIPQIHSSFQKSTNLESTLLAPTSKFLFVAYSRVEYKRLFNAASNIIDERRKRLAAQSPEILAFHWPSRCRKKNTTDTSDDFWEESEIAL